MLKPHSAAGFSSEEHMSDVCNAMLTRPIDLESAREEKVKELESAIKDREKVIAGLETLLSESRAEVEKLTFSVAKLRAAPASFYVLHRSVSRII